MKVKARLFHCETAGVINNNHLAAVKDSPGLSACAGSLGKENTHFNSPNLWCWGPKQALYCLHPQTRLIRNQSGGASVDSPEWNSGTLIFLLPVEKAAEPTAPADVGEDSTEPRPETSTADTAENVPEAEATCSEPAAAAEDASPDPGPVTAEPPPEAGPPADATAEQEEVPELEVSNEDTTSDPKTNTEPSPGDNGATGAANEAAAVAGAPGAATQSAGCEGSAPVQMCSEGNSEVLLAVH